MEYYEVERFKVSVSVSDEELSHNEISVDDILERNPAGWEFLRNLKSKAIEYTGYEWPNCAYSMEMNVIPGKGIIITFSETVADFVKGLKNSQKIAEHGSILLRELIKKIEEASEEEARTIIRDFEKNMREITY